MAIQTATLRKTALSPLSVNEAALRNFTHVAEICAADINNPAWTGQGDTVRVEIQNATGFGVKAAMIKVAEAFAATGTLTAQVGTSSDPDGVIAAQDVKTAGIKAPTAGFVPATAAGGAGGQMIVTFSTQASTGAPADITAGRLLVFLQLV